MGYPTRVRYGLRLLVRLALQSECRLSINDIAQEEEVSIKYLEQIVNTLKPLGILEAARGARGGYSLSCDPATITIDRVFERLGGLRVPVPCLEADFDCGRGEICTIRPFWEKLDAHLRAFLESVTLADIAASALQKKGEPRGEGGKESC